MYNVFFVFYSLHATDVGPLLGSRVQEQLGKEVRPALDAALTMAGGKDVHVVILMFCCHGKTGIVFLVQKYGMTAVPWFNLPFFYMP